MKPPTRTQRWRADRAAANVLSAWRDVRDNKDPERERLLTFTLMVALADLERTAERHCPEMLPENQR